MEEGEEVGRGEGGEGGGRGRGSHPSTTEVHEVSKPKVPFLSP